MAWEGGLVGWTLAAPTGDSIARADPDVDTDTPADWVVLSPADPLGGVIGLCGDGTCGAGEDCLSCPGDCAGQTGGKPASRYCCGDGTPQPAEGDGAACDGHY